MNSQRSNKRSIQRTTENEPKRQNCKIDRFARPEYSADRQIAIDLLKTLATHEFANEFKMLQGKSIILILGMARPIAITKDISKALADSAFLRYGLRSIFGECTVHRNMVNIPSKVFQLNLDEKPFSQIAIGIVIQKANDVQN